MSSKTTKSRWGVATYKTKAEMSENLQKALPDIDELRKLLAE